MRVLAGRWRDGYLDEAIRPAEDIRIDAEVWLTLGPVVGQYVERKPNLGMVRQYLRRIGPFAVARKIRSRLRERHRNRKYFAIGIGRILEGTDPSGGDPLRVLFFAYNHPLCAERVVVDRRFAVAWPLQLPPATGEILFFDRVPVTCPGVLLRHAGWSPHAGTRVPAREIEAALQTLREPVEKHLVKEAKNPTRRLEKSGKPPMERWRPPAVGKAAPNRTAVLFGLGNYAKTHILPYWSPRIPVVCIHEIDPLQLGRVGSGEVILDTASHPRLDEDYDAYIAAGYHHTHTPIALHALRSGRVAVIEKPLSTTLEQLRDLRLAYDSDPGAALFTCFHKRYSQLNDWVYQDLEVEPGEPIDYHCIVYEIPLPPLHWYLWPNSRSRLTSNGCHWIDHFMFLNRYSPVRRYDVWVAPRGSLVAVADLENGATFSMVLTDRGSERIGVQDHVELRANQTTVRMRDSAGYEAEHTSRIIRRRRVNPMSAYGRMYRTISRGILEGLPGDPRESLRSSELTLLLEEQYSRLSPGETQTPQPNEVRARALQSTSTFRAR